MPYLGIYLSDLTYIEEGTAKPKASRGLRGGVVDDIVQQLHDVEELVNRMAGTVTNEGLIGDDVMLARNTIRSAIQTNLDSSATTTISASWRARSSTWWTPTNPVGSTSAS